MTFIIGTFLFNCKSEHKQIKWNKVTRHMCKSDSISPYYKVVHYLNDFWNLFTDKVYLKKWMITGPEEKRPSFNFIP